MVARLPERREMKKDDKALALALTPFAILLIVGVLCLTGWVKNIVKLAHCDFKAPYKAEVVHAVGLLPPVGVITGWINIDDEPNK